MPPRWVWLLVNLIIISLVTGLAIGAVMFAADVMDREVLSEREAWTLGVVAITAFMIGLDGVWGQRERERLRYFAQRLRRCAMVDGYAQETLSKFDCAELADLIEGR